jgi:hypothetical protein
MQLLGGFCVLSPRIERSSSCVNEAELFMKAMQVTRLWGKFLFANLAKLNA